MKVEFTLKKYPSHLGVIYLLLAFNFLLRFISNDYYELILLFLHLVNISIMIILGLRAVVELQNEYAVRLSPDEIQVDDTTYRRADIREIRIGFNLLRVYLNNKPDKLSFLLKGEHKKKIIIDIQDYCELYGIKMRDDRKKGAAT